MSYLWEHAYWTEDSTSLCIYSSGQSSIKQAGLFMKTSSLTWAVYNDSMFVLYEAGKLWKCLPSHSQIDLTYNDLIITCNHSQPWVVICLMPGPGLFSQTNHLTSDLPQCCGVCVCAVMPVSRIRWSNGEGCTSCDRCDILRLLFSDQSLRRWNCRSLYYAERAGQGRPLELWWYITALSRFFLFLFYCALATL